jgi:hypothetical protein
MTQKIPEPMSRAFANACALAKRRSLKSILDARLAAHATILFVGWPLMTILAAAVDAKHLPYYDVSWIEALPLASVGVVLLAPDFAVAALLVCAASVMIFRRLGRPADDSRSRSGRLALEPIAFLLAVLWGSGLWYPTVLTNPFLLPFWSFPAVVVLSLLWVVVIVVANNASPRGNRLRIAATLTAVGLLAPLPATMGWARDSGRPSDIVVLGLDSVSQNDDVEALRKWIESADGAWYSRAVAPALFTNPVWASVIEMQPVRAHGVFHTFQPLPQRRAPFVEAARQAGFRTVSVFSDQLTCAVGSEAGFDEDRSGPRGWRQLVLRIVENSSILLPLVRPVLPRLPWSVAPPNHAGTFTYDLDREMREILFSGTEGERTLVAAHLTYLHMPAYPRLVDLTRAEMVKVFRAPAGSLRDRTFDWQDRETPLDALPLHTWKLTRLQSALTSAVDDTSFTKRGGRLLVFSDHGDRDGLVTENFTERRYYNVILATIGLPRRDVTQPISLIDIASLSGIRTGAEPVNPAVEFVHYPSEMWPQLVSSVKLRWSGSVEMDRRALDDLRKHLRTHQPWIDHVPVSRFDNSPCNEMPCRTFRED